MRKILTSIFPFGGGGHFGVADKVPFFNQQNQVAGNDLLHGVSSIIYNFIILTFFWFYHGNVLVDFILFICFE